MTSPDKIKKMRFSVCIPTYHRTKGLIRALNSFQNQTYQDFFEIIVCDNDSNAKIEKLVLDFNKTARVEAKYLSQDGGIQQVRSRLAFEAKGDLILMIDDDESACRELLEIYNGLFAEHKDIVAAGGPIKTTWENLPPKWITDYMKERKVTNLWGSFEPFSELKIGVGVSIWGGNMVFQRSIFEFTGFRPDIFKGRNMGNGESGLMAELAKRELKTAYVPEAYVLHYMDESRYNMRYVRSTASYMGVPFAYYRWHKADKSFYQYASEAFRIGKRYYKRWIKYIFYYFFKTKITDGKIGNAFRANVGFFQIKYILWLMTDNHFREVCDWDDFRPKSILKFYHDSFPEQDKNESSDIFSGN